MVVSQEVIYTISEIIDFTGVVIIAGGALIGVLLFARDVIQRRFDQAVL